MVHHTALEDPEQLEEINATHKALGYPESTYKKGMFVCYTFFIGTDGTTVALRNLHERTGCTRNQEINLSSLHIVLAGNFNKGMPNHRQMASLKRLLSNIDRIYPLKEVIGHREASPTECAGSYLNKWIKTIVVRKGEITEKILLKRITSYNPVPEQNDASPCIGSVNIDICHYRKLGVPIVALSQDLVKKDDTGFVKYGDWVKVIHHNPVCNYEGVVLDTMNKRFTNAVDILRMDKADNHGLCTGGTLVKMDKPDFFVTHPEQERAY